MANPSTIQIIKACSDVSDIKRNALNMLDAVRKTYFCEQTVLIHETIHGHIATLNRMPQHYIPGYENLPLRMDASDLAFLGTLQGFRWIEATSCKISLGFTNE